ncbi:acyltransferase family protein [Cephaloticoccus primus]|uniref:acyltransferase family protein n=1 Tax=Cephaloticoccus primus TaxID=1548207 RepID=UPI0009EDE1B6|nr:acyltransferase [Cephaloticoccus primus]
MSSQWSSVSRPSNGFPPKKLRFAEIDSLRAFGCVAVVVYHIIWQFNKVAGGGFWLYNLLGEEGNGFEGFLVFFIISGYVIPGSLRGERFLAVRRFAISRFFRLYPSFWFVLILGSLGKYRTLWDGRFWWGLTMLPSLAKVDIVLGHFWALEVTVISYVVLALLFLIFGKLRLRIVFPAYLISLALSFSRLALPSARGLWGRLPVFLSLLFFGACVREIMRLDFPRSKVRGQRCNWSRCIGVGGVAAGMVVISLYHIWLGKAFGDEGKVRQFLFLLLWVIVFLFWAVLAPVRLSLMRVVGRASYSTYLWHMVIIHTVVIGIKSGLFNILAGWPLPLYVAVFLPVCLVFGAFAYRWVEQPIGELGKRIADGRARDPSRAR